jgi:hypothetical protein
MGVAAAIDVISNDLACFVDTVGISTPSTEKGQCRNGAGVNDIRDAFAHSAAVDIPPNNFGSFLINASHNAAVRTGWK